MGRGTALLTLTTGCALAVAGLAPSVAGAARVAGHSAAGHSAVQHTAATAGGAGASTPFCKELGKIYQASAGAHNYCNGPQLQTGSQARPALGPTVAGAPPNVDAASVAEDVSPAGVPAQGQSEVSVAAIGNYVVQAWNDATGFLSACGAPSSKEELTGLGFSVNGGKSFTDLGGLPNLNCSKRLYEGDPSVAAYRVAGHDYFYISSLYDPVNGQGKTAIALDACTVTGSGTTASLTCGQPTIAATSSQCFIFKFRVSKNKTRTFKFCSFLDKDFLTIDPAHGRLYVSYSDFQVSGRGIDPEAMSVCDLGNAAGGTGPAGGTPAAPVCKHGTKLVKVSTHLLVAKPYATVAKAQTCENEGAYPAADPATGNVYVGYEHNWGTSLGYFECVGASTPIEDVITKLPLRCLTLTKTSPCAKPTEKKAVPVQSLESLFVPGYNRFPVNDFPRLAVSDRYHTVSMVWNDTRLHPYGDIMLQSFNRGTLNPVQSKPVVLDRPHNGGLSMLPALRTATANGRLDVSWYTRASVATANTGVMAALDVSPLAQATPLNVQVANALSNWIDDASLIVPNFGDYTDSAVSVTGSWPYVGSTLYVAWADGRLGIPQPFQAHLPAK
jgi:hypothetical protein